MRARLILSLRSVDIFRHLNIEQLTKLADQMAEARFEEGNWVFDQGDRRLFLCHYPRKRHSSAR